MSSKLPHAVRSPPIENWITLALLTLLVGGCYLVLAPFLSAVLWAIVLCCTTWPAFRRLVRVMHGRSGLAAAAGRFMTEEYVRFPSLPGSRRAVHRVVSLLADERPIITHCFAGKDRTGFTVAVVLEAIGVPRQPCDSTPPNHSKNVR